jgi:hypothetical protein
MSAMHVDDEQVQRYLHGQLTGESAALFGDHVDTCVVCRSRVEVAQRDERRTLALLRRLDHPVPAADARAVMRMRQRRRSAPLVRWAAGILLTVAIGGAAYAAPRSPVRAFVDRLIMRREVVRNRTQPPAAPIAVGTPQSGEVTQGVAAESGDRFVIEFAAPQPGDVAWVSLTDGAEIAVRAAGRATFMSDVDRISVRSAGASTRFDIEIPRDAPRVEIRVGDRRVFLKNASNVMTMAERGADQRYVIRLSTGLPTRSP